VSRITHSLLLKPLNICKPNLAGMVPFQNCVLTAPPFIVYCCFITSQNELNISLQQHGIEYLVQHLFQVFLWFFLANLYQLSILWEKNHIKIFSEIWTEMMFGWHTFKIMCDTPIFFNLKSNWNQVSEYRLLGASSFACCGFFLKWNMLDINIIVDCLILGLK
jgi:hypothetical protein